MYCSNEHRKIRFCTNVVIWFMPGGQPMSVYARITSLLFLLNFLFTFCFIICIVLIHCSSCINEEHIKSVLVTVKIICKMITVKDQWTVKYYVHHRSQPKYVILHRVRSNDIRSLPTSKKAIVAVSFATFFLVAVPPPRTS